MENEQESTELTPRENLVLAKIIQVSSSKNAGNETEKVAAILKFLKGIK